MKYRVCVGIDVAGDSAAASERERLQREAMTSIKLLSYLAELAMRQGCILSRRTRRLRGRSTTCRICWERG